MNFPTVYSIFIIIIGVTALNFVLMTWVKLARRGGHLLRNYSSFLTCASSLFARSRRFYVFLSDPKQRQGKIGALVNRLCHVIANFRRSSIKANIPPRMASFLLSALAFLFGIIGQVEFVIFQRVNSGAAWLVGSGFLWLVNCFLLETGEAGGQEVESAAAKPAYLIWQDNVRIAGLIFSGQLAIFAIILYLDRHWSLPYWDIFSLWVASWLVFFLMFCPPLRKWDGRAWVAGLRANWGRLLPFLLISLLAAGLRFYRLGEIPSYMENDEGLLGQQILYVLTGVSNNMFNINGSFGTMYYFFEALPVMLFGRTIFALRLWSALLGSLTIPLIGWVGWRLFGYKTALIAAALLATSHMHLHFSRVSPTSSSMDQFILLVFALILYNALTKRKLIWWAALGVIMGLGLYFYIGLRVMPLIFLTVLILFIVLHKQSLRPYLSRLAVTAAAMAITGAPMLAWAVVKPDVFNSRANQRVIFITGWLQNEIILTGKSAAHILWEQLTDSLLIFNYHYPEWFYQATVPMLGVAGGLLLLFGLIFALTRLKHLPFLIVSAWFWMTLLTGEVLLIGPRYNGYRVMGLMPAVCLLAASALLHMSQTVAGLYRLHGRKIAWAGMVALVLLEGGWSLRYYYRAWAKANIYGDDASRQASLIGSYLGGLPNGMEIYVAGNDQFRPRQWSSIYYLKGDSEYFEVTAPLELVIPSLARSPRAVVVVPAQMRAELEQLKIRYPDGQVTPHLLGGRLYFWSFQLRRE